MIYHFLRLAIRRVWQNKALSLLMIGGLGISIAASIWLIRYVNYHWEFDRFHANAEQMYRLNHHQITDQSNVQRSAMTVAGSAVSLQEQFPEVLDYVRLGRWIANDVVFQHKGKAIRDRDFFFVDPNFFEVFSFEWLAGDPSEGLAAPNTLWLSEQHATALFGTEDPIGQEVVFEGRRNFTVAGVFRQPPAQSHFQFGLLSSLSTVQQMGLDIYSDQHWEYPHVYAYVRLKEGADPQQIAANFNEEVNERYGKPELTHRFELQALADIHLYSDLQFELGPSGNGRSLWILLGVALLIQLLAWINFFNIYTAKTLAHLKHLGVRKVVGANRRQVAGQLIVESGILAVLGIGVGLLLANLGMPVLESYFPLATAPLEWKDFLWGNPGISLLLVGAVGIGMTIGVPAALLSSLKPAFSLGQNVSVAGLGGRLQKCLTTLQFMIIISLLAGTLVVYQQTVFMLDQDPGIALEDKLVLLAPLGTKNYNDLSPYYTQFKSQLESRPEVEQMTFSREIPGNALEVLQGVEIGGESKTTIFARYTVDHGFFHAFELPIIAGIDPRTRPTEERNLVVNASAMELLGFKDPTQILNQKINYYDTEHRVVAVVEDHHHRSLHHDKMPIIYDLFRNPTEDGYFILDLTKPSNPAFLSFVYEAYQEAFPESVFAHFDLKDHYQKQYRGDVDFRRVGLAFTILGGIVAALGLFGLSLLVFESRTKEVSIRKVLGASVLGVIVLLVKDLLRWVLIAIVLAIPVTIYFAQQWLSSFSYRVDLEWWVFALSGILALLMACLTMSYQSWRTAMQNPALVLKQE